MRALVAFILCVLAVPAFAADTYVPEPLKLLTERVKEHDQQICDLDERVAAIESKLDEALAAKPEPDKVDSVAVVKRDYDGAIIVPGSERIVERTVSPARVVYPSVTTSTRVVRGPLRTVSRSTSTTTGRRLKTTAELSRDIAARRTGRIYGRMARGQDRLVYQHLVSEHGYTSSQVNGLSLSDALELHNLAHGPRISAYTTGGVAVVAPGIDVFVPTPRTPTQPRTPPPNYGGNCANGQCARRSTSTAGSGWFPGKLFFGR